MKIERDQTGLIIIGSDSYPQSPEIDGGVEFTNAKNSVHDYFVKNAQNSFPSIKILDLFNSDLNEDRTDVEIRQFVSLNPQLTIIFIYYVGHGSYSRDDRCLILTVKSTRRENLSVSSIRLSSFGRTIRAIGSTKSVYVILDCCYSGAAIESMMSPGDVEIQNEIDLHYASRGITVLASSSKDFPSFKLPAKKSTLFTEGLTLALRNGDVSKNRQYLSLREIKEISEKNIRRLLPNNNIFPALYTPIQPEGDIADIPVFYNYAIQDRRADINIQADRIVEAMTNSEFGNVATLLLEFVKNFDNEKHDLLKYVMLATECRDLLEDKTKAYDVYIKNRKSNYKKILATIWRIKNQKM
ncbi:caspase family protein [Dyadobacter sp. CY261]|uniref:caspase family protein n=1 Tax=Dyadobacter sp. CY261 TaxID=2907203 RepID=UPI001F235F20|nr:caspase family protein [Dyadobacter sp. CY261]MCF0072465.1 caspase family protein [Dyadobacter sp. CY261]